MKTIHKITTATSVCLMIALGGCDWCSCVKKRTKTEEPAPKVAPAVTPKVAALEVHQAPVVVHVATPIEPKAPAPIEHPMIEHPVIAHPVMEHPVIEHPMIAHPVMEHPEIEHPVMEHPEPKIIPFKPKAPMPIEPHMPMPIEPKL